MNAKYPDVSSSNGFISKRMYRVSEPWMVRPVADSPDLMLIFATLAPPDWYMTISNSLNLLALPAVTVDSMPNV